MVHCSGAACPEVGRTWRGDARNDRERMQPERMSLKVYDRRSRASINDGDDLTRNVLAVLDSRDSSYAVAREAFELAHRADARLGLLLAWWRPRWLCGFCVTMGYPGSARNLREEGEQTAGRGLQDIRASLPPTAGVTSWCREGSALMAAISAVLCSACDVIVIRQRSFVGNAFIRCACRLRSGTRVVFVEPEIGFDSSTWLSLQDRVGSDLDQHLSVLSGTGTV